jgi:hypothetical protein
LSQKKRKKKKKKEKDLRAVRMSTTGALYLLQGGNGSGGGNASNASGDGNGTSGDGDGGGGSALVPATDGYAPLPGMYATVLALWLLLLLAWVANWLAHRRHHVTLQKAITLPIVLRVALTACYYEYWRLCRGFVLEDPESDTGITGLSDCPDKGIPWAIAVFLLMNQFATFTALLLIAKGYSITRADISRQEKRAILAISFAYAVTTAVGTAVSVANSAILILLYVLLVLLLYIALLRYIFLSIDANLRALRAQMFLIRQVGVAFCFCFFLFCFCFLFFFFGFFPFLSLLT